jgi:hypothetical protein
MVSENKAKLVDLALAAAGGFDRWARARKVRARLSMRGSAWDQVGQPAILDGVDVEVDLREQRTVFDDFTGAGLRGVYTPRRVSVEDEGGVVLLERGNPRASFPPRDMNTRWDDLHALYFGGYGVWNYLNTPRLLTRPGVRTEELQPELVDGERWRRLQVTFPDHLITHSSPQIWYYDESGLQRRLDYAPYVMGNRAAAHYTQAHRTVSGLVFPTHRYVLPRFDDGHLGPDPIIVADFSDLSIEFDDESGPGEPR